MTSAPMLVLFTDFGLAGPYMGQMRAALHRDAPGLVIVDLFADAPSFDIRAAAYLLAAYAPDFPAGAVFVCVVDPGVGGKRPAMVLRAEGRAGGQVFVGPGNGLFEIIARRAPSFKAERIAWRPERLSASFHGRDLFAPAAAAIARGDAVASQSLEDIDWRHPDWPDDLCQVIYLDHYGNAITGLRATGLPSGQRIAIASHELHRSRTFGEVTPGQAFWYENANGLVEIAVNQGSAAQELNLTPGTSMTLL